jgi:hypothetical protein
VRAEDVGGVAAKAGDVTLVEEMIHEQAYSPTVALAPRQHCSGCRRDRRKSRGLSLCRQIYEKGLAYMARPFSFRAYSY